MKGFAPAPQVIKLLLKGLFTIIMTFKWSTVTWTSPFRSCCSTKIPWNASTSKKQVSSQTQSSCFFKKKKTKKTCLTTPLPIWPMHALSQLWRSTLNKLGVFLPTLSVFQTIWGVETHVSPTNPLNISLGWRCCQRFVSAIPKQPVTPDPHGQWESIPLAFRQNAQQLEVKVATEPPGATSKQWRKWRPESPTHDFEIMEDINLRDMIWSCMQIIIQKQLCLSRL